MNAVQHINQDSGKVEYYTPPEIIEAALDTMDGIDLDPFSSDIANLTVKAAVYFTKDHGELTFTEQWNLDRRHPWKKGIPSVWMNHPFSRTMNARCVQKLIHEFKKNHIRAACCITFSATSEAWFRPLMDYLQCFLSPRTNYLDKHGNKVRGVTKGSVVTYLGYDLTRFQIAFEQLGKVKV